MNREQLKEFISKVSKKYPNIDFTHLLPKENIFKKIFKKDITKEEFNKIYNEIINTLLELELKRFPYTFYYSSKEINSRLLEAISIYNLFRTRTVFQESTFKLYPITLAKETEKALYIEVMRDIIKTSIETGESIETLMEKKIVEYNNNTENFKNTLKNSTMMPYYGTPSYIIKHSKYILDSAKKLKVDTTELEQLIQKLENFNKTYPNTSKKSFTEEYPYYEEEYKIAFRSFEEIYIQILKIEKELMTINEPKWKSYLTNPINHNDANFRYLIHTFTGGFVPPNEMRKACTTLVTSSLLAIPYGTYGLIYDFDKEAVDTICTEDAGSWIITKEEFIDTHLPISWQLHNPQTSNIFYEYENTSKLVTPEEVERSGIQNNLKHNNNQPLTYNKCIYTEIFLNSKAKPRGVFYTDDCQNIQEVIEYAKKYNLPVVHLSLQKLRLMNQKQQIINNLLNEMNKNQELMEEEEIEESKKHI